jgi:hypothetical protein
MPHLLVLVEVDLGYYRVRPGPALTNSRQAHVLAAIDQENEELLKWARNHMPPDAL